MATAMISKSAVDQWRTGIPEEVQFWDNWLRTKGSRYSTEAFQFRFDPEAPLHPAFQKLIPASEGATVRILDVGAGPATTLGKIWPGVNLQVTAIDPLANAYSELLKSHSMTAPAPTIEGFGESIVAQFGENQFDFVYSKNAIDHSVDAPLVIEQMYAVAKPGCVVYLVHRINEADNQNHMGFHHWNFYEENGEFIVEGRGQKTNVNQLFQGRATVELQYTGTDNDHLLVTIKKN